MLRFVFIFAFINICLGSYQSDIREALQPLNDLKPLARIYRSNPSSPAVLSATTDLINSTINRLATQLAEYDPANVEQINLNIERSRINLQGSISNLHVEGFSGFVVTALSFSLLRQTFSLTIRLPEVALTTDYDIDGSVSIIPTYGKGSLNVAVTGVEVTASGKASLSSPISLENLELGYSIGGINVAATGLINNEDFSELVSELLTDILADFFNDISSIVTTYLSPLIENAINSKLAGQDDTDTDTKY